MDQQVRTHGPPRQVDRRASLVEPNRARLVTGKTTKLEEVMLGTILIVLLILFLIGALPTWGHSRNWGYGPSGLLGIVAIILIILLVMGRI